MKRFFLCGVVLLGAAVTAAASSAPGCSNVPHADHPSAQISNGDVDALVFLPDATKGYYRAMRFDWAGVVPCLSYKGHRYWGEWFSKYDPMIADSITGPVEEFRTDDGGLDYGTAKPGELFVKIGVGTLRKIDDSPYKFMTDYPLVDSGKWTTHVSKRSIRFEQKLQSPIGYAYVYAKTLQLDKHGAVLALEHELKNVGTKTIETDVYDHDFFMLDDKPTGPGMKVKFAFTPSMDPVPDASLAKITGNELEYLQELQPHQTVAGYVTGYSDKVSDYDVTVEDTTSGVGVEQTADSPIAKFYLWSIPTTISPEAYIHLNIPPGKSQKWVIRYRFFAK